MPLLSLFNNIWFYGLASILLLMLEMMLFITATGMLSNAVNTRCLNSSKDSFVIFRATASPSKYVSMQSTSGERGGISKRSTPVF